METRPAVELDVDEIARVWLESYRHADGSPAEMPPFEHFRTRIETEMVSGMWAVTVAVCEGRIVAFLSLVPADSVLRELFVLPSMQRRGIGSLLLGQAMRALPEGFTLGAAAANLGACRFYEASGLELVEDYIHPRHGILYRLYGWHVAGDRPWNLDPRRLAP
ncbi:MAG: GNAT family N-acetyltransferase [Aliidongia sp.]